MRNQARCLRRPTKSSRVMRTKRKVSSDYYEHDALKLFKVCVFSDVFITHFFLFAIIRELAYSSIFHPLRAQRRLNSRSNFDATFGTISFRDTRSLFIFNLSISLLKIHFILPHILSIPLNQGEYGTFLTMRMRSRLASSITSLAMWIPQLSQKMATFLLLVFSRKILKNRIISCLSKNLGLERYWNEPVFEDTAPRMASL